MMTNANEYATFDRLKIGDEFTFVYFDPDQSNWVKIADTKAQNLQSGDMENIPLNEEVYPF